MSRSDTFNRSDGAIGTPSDSGSAWSVVNGTWEVSSNQARETGGAGTFQRCVLEASTSEAEVQVTLAAVASKQMAIAGRHSSGSNYWLCRCYGDSSLLRIYKVETGTQTFMDGYSGTVADGDVIRFRFEGNVITVYQNGTQRIQVTDSFNSTATQYGLVEAGFTGARWDDFSITDLTPSGFPAVLPFVVSSPVDWSQTEE